MSTQSILEEFKPKFNIIDIGYTEKSEPLSYTYFKKWVENNYQGPLSYLADERMLKREDLKLYYPEFKSSLVFLFSYQETKKNEKESDKKIASYVNGFEGMDYHFWIKDKLQKILSKLQEVEPTLEGVFSLDTQPILERDLAYRAGLGWFGKNSMLIHKKEGSYFLIGALILNQKLDLIQKEVEVDHCGKCTRCIDACPTNAIIEDKVIDSSKCISTFTIELFKETKPPKGYTQAPQIFGCDICQEVCPWNIKPLARQAVFQSEESLLEKFFINREIEEIVKDLEKMSNREFRRKFKGTPMERTGRVGILKNLRPFMTN